MYLISHYSRAREARAPPGQYAAKVAAIDSRVKAAVSWGGMYHLRNYRTIPANTQAGFKYVTGSKTFEEAKAYFESIDLKDYAAKIACPLMIVNGGQDPITPPEKDESRGEGTDRSVVLE